MLGAEYKTKKVFGYANFGGDDLYSFFPVWSPGLWNSFCISVSKPRGFEKITINGEQVTGTPRYMGYFQDEDTNIVLMNSRVSDEPHHGAVTDVNVWSRILSDQEIEDWALCRADIEGKRLNWEKLELVINKVNISELPRNETCLSYPKKLHYIGFNIKKNFDETEKFCQNIGGRLAVTRDQQSLAEISEEFAETCELGYDWLYSGYVDQEEVGRWSDLLTGETMPWTNWAPGYPLRYPASTLDCAVHDLLTGSLRNSHRSELSCPVCEMTRQAQTFVLSGVCRHSSVDSHYVMRSSTEFQGFIQTRMVYSTQNARWEIVQTTRATGILAFTEDNFPLGLHPWYFLDSNCTDPGVRFRSLNLHLEVEQPGHFCCDDGTCIQSNLVCNYFPDCTDGGDEKNCTFMHFKNKKDIKKPPLEFHKGKISRFVLNGTFNIMKVFEIDQVDSTFDLHFVLEIVWIDRRLNFEFLKSRDYDNYLYDSYKEKIWSPMVEFSDIWKVVNDKRRRIFVLRKGLPTLDSGLDSLRANEIYTGRENPLKIFIERRIQFSCAFDNIKNYPFGKQRCSLSLKLVGSANHMTTIDIQNIFNLGPTVVGQYVIDDWLVETDFLQETGKHLTRVTMVLSRKIESIFMVTYLPTILMNMINQATNYITGEDKYSLIYTINITCMMVLASIYLSVSASLPTTSDIKPIEVWLIFNLAFPFVTILINVILQVIYKRSLLHVFIIVSSYHIQALEKRCVGGKEKENH